MIIKLKKNRIVLVFPAFLLFISLITTACQSTPSLEVVAQKGNGELEEAIKQTAALDGPTTQTVEEEIWEYQKVYDSGNCLTVNAEILNEKMSGIPVVSLQEKPFSSGEQIKKIVDVFCPEAKVYDVEGVTKSQIQEQIVVYEQQLSQLKNGTNNGDQAGIEIIGGYDPEKSLEEQIRASIEQLKQDYENAPDDSNLPEASFQLESEEDGSLQSNMLAIKNGHSVSCNFVNWSSDDSIYLGSTFLLDGLLSESEDSENHLLDSFINPSDINANENFMNEKDICDTYVKDMGIDYMSLQSVCIYSNGYDFYYTRTMNGLPETYANTYLGTQTIDSDGIIVMDLWTSEYLRISIINGKVVSAKWNNPSEVVTVDNENVQTKYWEEIKEIFLKHMDYVLSPEPISNGGGTETTIFSDETEIVINRIEFGLTKVIMENSNKYKLIPTWSFLGYDSNYVQKGVNQGAKVCFVTINAIDGSVIDRGLMY